MEKLEAEEAAGYAAKCIRPLRKALKEASVCSSSDAQKKYFDFLGIFLSEMSAAASACIGMVNEEKPVSDICMGLNKFINNNINKMKQGKELSKSRKQELEGQMNINSLFGNEKE